MFAFTSCNPDKAQCWKLQITDEDNKVTEYLFYGTGDEADAQLEICHRADAKKIRPQQGCMSASKKEVCHGGHTSFLYRLTKKRCAFITVLSQKTFRSIGVLSREHRRFVGVMSQSGYRFVIDWSSCADAVFRV